MIRFSFPSNQQNRQKMVICKIDMQIKLPSYTSRDYAVLAIILLPISIVINSILLGAGYYSDWRIFLVATVLGCGAFAVNFILCGGWAVLMKKRFPAESQVGTRLTFMILTFIVITGLFLYLMFRGYEQIELFDYRFNENNFFLAYIGMAIVNIFITLMMEGVDRYEKWKESLKETEDLQKVFRQSQLQGLKSQLNPHFLFNSLNSLSSLISEDEDQAERFLNEMSKVYRYMLRNDEEQMVSLETELQFVDSYLYLLKARYGEGLQLTINVSDEARQTMLPPLSLQVLIENAFTQNSMSKTAPLKITIESKDDKWIVVRNNLQPKVVTETVDVEAGLDNLINRYQLINRSEVLITDQPGERVIRLPLISKTAEVML
jgi:two-component system, LytTR family, sensor kinase